MESDFRSSSTQASVASFFLRMIDPLNKNVANLHRKLKGETHYQVIMIYLWNYHTVTCTLVYKKVSFGAMQIKNGEVLMLHKLKAKLLL